MKNSLIALLSVVSVAQAAPSNVFGAYGSAGLRNVDYYPILCAASKDADFFSCDGPSTITNSSCCYEKKGAIMQTQFWDYDTGLLRDAKAGNASAAPQKSNDDPTDPTRIFTIHGLWNDLCNGLYLLNCVPELEIGDSDNVTDIIATDFGRRDLYDAMIKFWVNNEKSNVPDGGSKALWVHEYNKHGTCFNTVQPHCFQGAYDKFQAAVAFFQKTMEVWSTLPTYEFLAQAGILPTTQQQYDLADIQEALKQGFGGADVYVGCEDGAIDEIWYYFRVRGSVLTGEYQPRNSMTNSTCPQKVWYIPKTE